MKLEDLMNDRGAFEGAMFRARLKAEEEGRNPTFREMLDEAQKILQADYDRLAAEIKASGSSPSTPENAASPPSVLSPEKEPLA